MLLWQQPQSGDADVNPEPNSDSQTVSTPDRSPPKKPTSIPPPATTPNPPTFLPSEPIAKPPLDVPQSPAISNALTEPNDRKGTYWGGFFSALLVGIAATFVAWSVCDRRLKQLRQSWRLDRDSWRTERAGWRADVRKLRTVNETLRDTIVRKIDYVVSK